MKQITGSTTTAARRSAIGVLTITVAVALMPEIVHAQSSSGAEKGAHLGASGGVYFESSEGKSGHALAGSGILGYRFNARWAIQVELGKTGTVYCYDQVPILAANGSLNGYRHVPAAKGKQGPNTICHSDSLLNIDVVRRFTAGSLRPHIMLGLGAGVHLGVGVEVPFGGRFALVPGIDFNVGPEVGSARPKVALLVRF